MTEPLAELTRALGPLFATDHRPGKWDLIDAAIRGRVHPALLITLVDIADRPYLSLDDLLTVLDPSTGAR